MFKSRHASVGWSNDHLDVSDDINEFCKSRQVAGLHIPQRALGDGLAGHLLQTQRLRAKLDFVERFGFGLAAFVFHGFQTACTLLFQFGNP
ncbi:Uncharacterised protein [Neisseria dentiae]|nr:Uncharacterised protein [Neisseria dentiae]